MTGFDDPEHVARYAQGPKAKVPGFEAMQRMAGLLVAERVPANGHVLVLGAGGGLELKVFAEMQPGWHLCGVDPSAQMLDLARRTLGPLVEHADLHEGYIDTAPEGPFDGATCLLTLHFLTREERAQTLAQLHRRLKPGAPLVVAHHSIPGDAAEQTMWLTRYAAFSAASGMPDANPQQAITAIRERLPFLSPDEDAAMLRDAGFADVALFYAGFTFRGWVGYRA